MSILNAATPIEKTQRTPAGRSSLMAFVTDGESEAVLRTCLADLGIAGSTVTRGGVAKAVQQLSTERSPMILIVDLSSVDLPVSHMHHLAEVCEPGVTVIAVGNHNDIGLYRDLLQAGVSDYIVKPLTPQLLAKSLRAATNAGEATPISQKLGKLVAFIGARGGVGTTTIAANMAWHLANRQSRRVALLDLDLHSGDCALMLNVKPTKGLREALENPLRIDSIFLERAMSIHGERLFVLTGEEPLQEDVRFDAAAVETLINVLRTQFHYILVDVPRIPAPPFRRALELAELRVIVADQTLRSVRDAVRLRPMLGEGNARHQNLLVINRSGEGGRREVTLKEMEQAGNLHAKCVIPFQPKLFSTAASEAVIPAMRRGSFAEAIATLAVELSGRTPEKHKWWSHRR